MRQPSSPDAETQDAMNEVFEKNAGIVRERWPGLHERLVALDVGRVPATLTEGISSTLSVHGIQLSSRHDRRREAEIQACDLPHDAHEIWLYGAGLGDLPRLLLERAGLVHLHVRLLNETIFALVLHVLDQSDWLADPRVDLAGAADDGQIRSPFFAQPPELVLADERNARMRDQVQAEIERLFANRWLHNHDPYRLQRGERNREFWTRDPDVSELFERGTDEIFLLASGPTLARHYDFLREVAARDTRPLFICADTAWKPLAGHGIAADIVVSLDERITMDHFPGEVPPSTCLVYFPFAQTALLKNWPGPRYVAFSGDSLLDGYRKEAPHRTILYASGSVLHPAADLAVRMGACTIRLFGADFSFPDQKTHSGWDDHALTGAAAPVKHWIMNGDGERVGTQPNFRAYLYHLEAFIARHPEVRFINTSRAGAKIEGAYYDPEYCR
jgi:hypothetical protein